MAAVYALAHQRVNKKVGYSLSGHKQKDRYKTAIEWDSNSLSKTDSL
jgi:hypothetical protein